MRKPIKLTVSLLICGLMLLSGCGTHATSLPSELVGKTGNYPNSINILTLDFFKENGAANTDQAKQEWLDEMSQRYGVTFKITDYYTYSESTGSSSATSGAAASETIESSALNQETDDKFVGLISIRSIIELKAGIKEGSIMPLEGYLADNAVWNSLPDNFKSLFEMDGHIYAIPTSVSRNLHARMIRDEALQETGITVTDLDSFRDFAAAYKEETGNAAAKGVYVPDVIDILNAFGLYPSNEDLSPFCYDPTDDCFVDWMTKPAAVDALEYLRELYEAGALYCKGTDLEKIRATFESGLFPSAYQQYFDYDNCTEVLTLNSEYSQAISTVASGYVMTEGTPQPQETINLLIDMLFGSEQNYLQFRLGSSKNYTLNSDGTITIAMVKDSEGNYVKPGMPNLAGELSDIFPYSAADILYSKNGVVTTASNSGEYNTSAKLLNDSLKNGSAIEIQPEYQIIQSATYDANITNFEILENNVGNQHDTYFGAAIKMPFKSVQQWLDEYKEQMFNLGGNKMLDEMNSAIGKKTAYYYG